MTIRHFHVNFVKHVILLKYFCILLLKLDFLSPPISLILEDNKRFLCEVPTYQEL